MTNKTGFFQMIEDEVFPKMKVLGVHLRSPEHLFSIEVHSQKIFEEFRKAYELNGVEEIHRLLEKKEYYVGIEKPKYFLPSQLDLKVNMSSDEPEEVNNLWEEWAKTFQLKVKSTDGEKGFTFKEKDKFSESSNPSYSLLAWEYNDLPSKDKEVKKFFKKIYPELQNAFDSSDEHNKVVLVWESLQDYVLEDEKYEKAAYELIKTYVEGIVKLLKQV